MASFLASEPLKQGQNLRSIWVSYQKSHPSRTAVAYRQHHQVRRDEYFNSKVAELKAANNGQPIVYEHPEVEESSQAEVAEEEEEEEEGQEEHSFVPFIQTRAVPDTSQPTPSRVPVAHKKGTKPLVKGKCSNCNVDQAARFYRIKGKGDEKLCGGCYMAEYMANRKKAGTENRALAARRRKALGDDAEDRSTSSDLSSLEDSSEESSISDASKTDNPRPSRPPAPSSSSRSSSARKPSRAGKGCRSPWTKQEDDFLVHLLSSWKETRNSLWEAFSRKHPRRTPESARKRYEGQRETMDPQVVARRKTRPPAASESEELEEDDSIGDDQDSDDDTKALRPSASRPSSSTVFIDRKRPQEPVAGSSKKMRFDSSNASTNAVASSSKLPSSSNPPYHHRHSLPASNSHSHPYSSNHRPQPRSSLPSSSQQPVASNLPNSSRPSNRPSTSSSSSYPRPPPAPPLAPPRPPPPPSHQAASSSSEEDLEPPPSSSSAPNPPAALPPPHGVSSAAATRTDPTPSRKSHSLARTPTPERSRRFERGWPAMCASRVGRRGLRRGRNLGWGLRRWESWRGWLGSRRC